MNVVDPTEVNIDSIELARAIAAAAADKGAYDIVLLDLRGLVDFTDLFLICTARNPRQVKGLAESLRNTARRDLGVECERAEGLEASRWALLDLPGVVVHVFVEPMRGFYDLDRLWRDAPRLEVPTGDVWHDDGDDDLSDDLSDDDDGGDDDLDASL
jgi:ribosome-associated protein